MPYAEPPGAAALLAERGLPLSAYRAGTSVAVLGHSSLIAAIVSETVPELGGEREDIGEPGRLSELSLPFFWDEADYDACMKADTGGGPQFARTTFSTSAP